MEDQANTATADSQNNQHMRSAAWFTNENVAQYYRQTRWQYRWLWTGKHSLALHYGYWDSTTRDHIAALHKLNEELAARLRLGTGDYVLDAGCGWGGSCLWLAHHHNVKSLGITIEPDQVGMGRDYARRCGVIDKVTFDIGDYHQIDRPADTFDGVWAIESVCYSHRLNVFAEEAFRVLKPGGRIVVADFFRSSRDMPARDDALFHRWLKQWIICDLTTFGEFRATLERAGFTDVVADDVTANVRPSANRLLITGLVTGPLALVFRAVGIHTKISHGNWKASILQHRALKRGTWRYGIISATKPLADRESITHADGAGRP